VRTLIERSGAAQQLLPEELRPPLRREAVPLIALDQ